MIDDDDDDDANEEHFCNTIVSSIEELLSASAIVLLCGLMPSLGRLFPGCVCVLGHRRLCSFLFLIYHRSEGSAGVA